MSRRIAKVLAVAALAVAVGAGVALAAFSATTSNSSNAFTASATYPDPLVVASGTYTGDGTDNRAITQPGFQPDIVIIKGTGFQAAYARTSTMTGDLTKPMITNTALSANLIQTLEANGFTIGADAGVNGSGVTYHWIAIKAVAGVVKLGTYTGNGTSQSITGAGFSPEYAMVLGAGARYSRQRYAGGTLGWGFDADAGASDEITSLGSDGFSVGAAPNVNANGETYHYVALNEVAGTSDAGSYAGTGTDDTPITGVGFQPDYVFLRAHNSSLPKMGMHRPASMDDPNSVPYRAVGATSSAIKSLQPDGFSVGTASTVNSSDTTYYYFAIKNAGSNCSLPGVTRTRTASADAWVDESAPAANNGALATLKVRSQASANARALVQFDLPSKPSGCTVASAKLRLYDGTPAAGRTLEALRASASWSETGVTWSNQPGTTGLPATATAPSAAGWVEWTVTDQVAALYSGSNQGLLVRDASEGGAGVEQLFDSREATNKPQLVVTFG